MYLPDHNREDRLDVQHSLIEAHPLGLLISIGPRGLVANALPFLLRRDVGHLGQLAAHMARANTQWQGLDGQQVLIAFQGPLSYVTPSLFPTKQQTGKVVPTWNYVMVQARGIARIHTDADWLLPQINGLTSHQETNQPKPWAVSDAPGSYIGAMMRGIVGVSIEINEIEGKWKVNQDEPEADRRGVVAGMIHENPVMASLVREYGHIEEKKTDTSGE